MANPNLPPILEAQKEAIRFDIQKLCDPAKYGYAYFFDHPETIIYQSPVGIFATGPASGSYDCLRGSSMVAPMLREKYGIETTGVLLGDKETNGLFRRDVALLTTGDRPILIRVVPFFDTIDTRTPAKNLPIATLPNQDPERILWMNAPDHPFELRTRLTQNTWQASSFLISNEMPKPEQNRPYLNLQYDTVSFPKNPNNRHDQRKIMRNALSLSIALDGQISFFKIFTSMGSLPASKLSRDSLSHFFPLFEEDAQTMRKIAVAILRSPGLTQDEKDRATEEFRTTAQLLGFELSSLS